jgi:hypothetical protein
MPHLRTGLGRLGMAARIANEKPDHSGRQSFGRDRPGRIVLKITTGHSPTRRFCQP